jgi:hypothetical protein
VNIIRKRCYSEQTKALAKKLIGSWKKQLAGVILIVYVFHCLPTVTCTAEASQRKADSTITVSKPKTDKRAAIATVSSLKGKKQENSVRGGWSVQSIHLLFSLST